MAACCKLRAVEKPALATDQTKAVELAALTGCDVRMGLSDEGMK